MSTASQNTASESGVARIPFTAGQEATVRSLAFWLKLTGWIHIVLSAFDLLNMFATRNAGGLFSALIKILVGTWCLQASRAFHKVATSDDADQSNLMVAFGKLRVLFLLQAMMVILALVLVAAGVLAFLFFAFSRVHQSA